MARRRMFSNDVINNDNFIEMPDSSQNLYFFLSMTADDDGFISNYKSIMRMLGKKEDDLKVLIAKQFIIPFENGILVIRHWKMNNNIQKDRYKETVHKEEKALLTVDKSNVYSLDTDWTRSIGKVSKDKVSIGKDSIGKTNEQKKELEKFQQDSNTGETLDNDNDDSYHDSSNDKKNKGKTIIYFENDELNDLFLDFLETRRKLKAVNSERAINLQIKELEPYDDSTKIKMIEQAIKNSWKSVYKLKEEKLTTEEKIRLALYGNKEGIENE